MIYTICTSAGAKRTDFDGNSNSTHDHKVQTNNELSLSFTLHDYVALEVNDYIDIGNMRFVLMKPYKPVMKSTKEYAYDVKFYGPENIAGAAIFLDSDYNPISSYYDTPSAQLAFIVSCINRAAGDTHYHVGEVISSEPINVEYTRGCTCLEALSTLSKACNTEWWLDGVNFNLSKCEHGEPLTLAYGQGLLNLTKEISDTDEFFTRLLPTGSTKNIVASKYGHTTLQLPGGKKWIDRNVDLYGIKEKWEENAFADIFPRFTGMVGTVRTEVQTIDGSEVTVYFFTSPDIPFNPNIYSLANVYKHVVFKSGDLNSQDFEANWHEDTAEWELITKYPTESTQLPGDNVVPRTSDKYTVYNLDMPTEYYSLAEQEFEDAVSALLDNAAIDFATYKAPIDHVYLEDNEITLTIGRRVRLENNIYFPEGYRDSRITRIVRKLSDLNDMDIEISNTIIQGQYATLKSDVADLKNTFAQTLANEILNIIRTNSSADLSDENVLSSLRTLKEIKNRALSRLDDDVAAGLITFLKGLLISDKASINADGAATVQQLIALIKAKVTELEVTNTATAKNVTVSDKVTTLNLLVQKLAETYDLDVSNVATLFRTIVKDYVSSETFIAGLAGEGFKLYKALSGDWNLEVDNVTIRKAMTIFELIISKIRSVNGGLVISQGNGRVKSVSETTGSPTYYVLGIEGDMTFLADDFVRCQVFSSIGAKYYWVRVDSINGNSIVILKSEFPEGTVPAVGDDIIQMGNKTDKSRQGLLYLTASEDGKPRFSVLDGVNSTDLTGKNKVILGCLDGITDSDFPSDAQPSGYGLWAANVFLKGLFILRNGKSVEDELNDQITAVKTAFEIREGQISTKVQAATTAAAQAAGSASAAAGSASTAGAKASDATKAASDAQDAVDVASDILSKVTTKESSINQTADNITLQVKDVTTKVTTATNKANEAATSATNAKTSETNAAGSASTASGKATAASNSAKSAADSATAAAGSASDAADVLTEVTTKQSSINQTAANITSQVSEVNTKATQAASSASNASQSASAAASSATTASSKASAAASSATAAANSANAASSALQSVTTKQSEINQTASKITLQVSEVTTKTAQATNAAELATAMSKGKMLYRDPVFASGYNSVSIYNNNGNGQVTISRVSGISGNPNDSGYCLKIISNGSASPGLGGFYFANQTRSNAVFITRFIANIPVGYTVEWASNATGTGGGRTWLTSQAGTGTWMEYVCRVNCGSSGSFSSTNFFYLTGGSTPVTWYVAYATVFDVTGVDDTPSRDEIKAGIGIVSGGISFWGQVFNFAGMVTFSSLASDAQNKINTAQSTANTAVSNASTAQSTANTANSTANSALSIANTANGGLSTLKNSLGAMAYQNAVSLAKLDSSILDGGYFKTSLIDANAVITGTLLASKISTTDITTSKLTVTNGAKIGDFTVYNQFLHYSNDNKSISVGGSVLPSTTAIECNISIENTNSNSYRKMLVILNASVPNNNTIGDNRSYYDALRIESGSLRVAPGNLVDMPGVLLAGRVVNGATIQFQFGRKGRGNLSYNYAFAPSVSSSVYRITHNLGHTNYSLLVTPFLGYGNNWLKIHVIIRYIASNYAEFVFVDSGTSNSLVTSDYCFSIIGENTTL